MESKRMRMKIVVSFMFALIGASCFSKTLTVHYCNNFAEAEVCSTNCRNAPKGLKFDPKHQQKLEFLLNKYSRSIMVKTYFGDIFSNSRVMKNCNILDENNWDCSEEPLWIAKGPWMLYDVQRMNNGFYVHGQYTSKETKYNSSSASCAK
jgi:hypothetical protein